MERWQTDVKDWTLLNKDLANFYLAQAELHLKANIDLSDRITVRGTWLLSVIIPLTGVTTGYILTQVFGQPANLHLLYAACASFILLLACLIILASLVGVRQWMVPGGQPREILTSHMLDTEIDNPELRYVSIVLGEIERTQDKIDFTIRINQRRLNHLKIVIWALVAGFVLIALFVTRQFLFFITF